MIPTKGQVHDVRLACDPESKSLREGGRRARQFSMEEIGAVSHAGRSRLLDFGTGKMDMFWAPFGDSRDQYLSVNISDKVNTAASLAPVADCCLGRHAVSEAFCGNAVRVR